MLKRIFPIASGILVGCTLTVASLVSCHQLGTRAAATQSAQASTVPAATMSDLPAEYKNAAAVSAAELRDILASMADSHEDKIKLSWWVGAPVVGKPVDKPFQPFFDEMGKRNKALKGELEAWAKQHHMDLTYHEPAGWKGRRDAIMSKRQEKLVRGDSKEDFEHHILVQMYIDYENGLSDAQALLPSVSDPALKAYLEKAERMYAQGSAEILGLLKRYKFE